jgi:DNA-binding transcriptional LysR family regulator
VRVTGRYVSNHSEVRLEGALNDLGLASRPEFIALAHLEAGTLVTVLNGWEHVTAYSGTVWLLYPPNRFLATKLRVWIDHVVAGLAAPGPAEGVGRR